MQALAMSSPSPIDVFKTASNHYRTAVDALTIQPNVRKDPRQMISVAAEQATIAMTALEPFAQSPDQFVQRNAVASLAAARGGVSALQSASTTLDAGAVKPQIPVSQLLEAARGRFEVAEQVLWQE